MFETIINLLERLVVAIEKIAKVNDITVAQPSRVSGKTMLFEAVHREGSETPTGVLTYVQPDIPADLSKLTIEALRELAAKLGATKDFPKGTRANTIIAFIETKRKELETAPPAEKEAPVESPDPLNFDPLGGFDALGEDPIDDGVKVYLSKDVTETLRAFVMGAVGVGADHPEFPARFNKIKDEVLMPLLNRHGVSSAQNLPENVANAIMNDEKAGPKLREVYLNCVEAMVR
jgi:hypothetical protein